MPGNQPDRRKRLKRLKQLLGAFLVLASFAFLAYYWHAHPEIVTQLQSVSLPTILMLLSLYLIMTLLLVLIYDTILRICSKPIPLGEHTLLTMYSSIINFFGPLQSGPGFRTVYLKQRHGVPIKSYLSTTLVYYALFGGFNLLFLAVGIIPLAYAPILLLILLAVYLSRTHWAGRIAFLSRFNHSLRNSLAARLAALTLLQAILVVVIYSAELRAVGSPVSLTQAIVYSGAGSLALFVSLTPAALGFRESFQYVTQGIHHVDSNAIIAANILDRSVYVAFLGLLFVIILAFHARQRLYVKETSAAKSSDT